MQALQIVSTDVKTACYLGVCIALRVTEAVPMVNAERQSNGEESMFTIAQLESALRLTGLGK